MTNDIILQAKGLKKYYGKGETMVRAWTGWTWTGSTRYPAARRGPSTPGGQAELHSAASGAAGAAGSAGPPGREGLCPHYRRRAGSWYLNQIEAVKVAAIVDHIFVMGYDLHGTWDTYADFNAPLYAPSGTSPRAEAASPIAYRPI